MSNWKELGGGLPSRPDWRAHARLSRFMAERAERYGDSSLAAYLREAAAKVERRAGQTIMTGGRQQ